MILGLWCGEWLKSARSAADKLKGLIVAGVVLALAGLALQWLHLSPIVKRIWTSSYTLYSGGLVILILAGFYAATEIKGWRRWTFPLLVIGANSIAVYVMSWTLEDFVKGALARHVGTAPFAFLGAPFEPVLKGGADGPRVLARVVLDVSTEDLPADLVHHDLRGHRLPASRRHHDAWGFRLGDLPHPSSRRLRPRARRDDVSVSRSRGRDPRRESAAGRAGGAGDRRHRGRDVLRAVARRCAGTRCSRRGCCYGSCSASCSIGCGPSEPMSRAIGRGVAAAVLSGVAFYLISGIWTQDSHENPEPPVALRRLVVRLPAGVHRAVLEEPRRARLLDERARSGGRPSPGAVPRWCS